MRENLPAISTATYAAWSNLCELFLSTADRVPERACLWHKVDDRWQALTWRQVEGQISLVARGLRALGVVAGDRVAIVSENRPEWLIAELAILALGAVAVPAYVTNTAADHLHVLNNSEARLVIVSTETLATTVIEAARLSSHCRTLVAMHAEKSLAGGDEMRCLSWSAVLAAGAALPDDLRACVARLRRDDLAVIFHTSGTGGEPRGVMLTHGSILANCMGGYQRLQCHIEYGNEVFLSFLPLSHAYEHATGQFTALSIGAQIYYCDAIERLLHDLLTVRPTIMTVVPRLFETLHARAYRAISRKGPLHRYLFEQALRIGAKRYRAEQRLGPLEWLFDISAGRAVRATFARLLGGRLKFMVSGGAPLNHEIGLFFAALGVRLVQGYGQTEAGPVISCNPTVGYKIDSVGPPLAGVELRIAADGEICVRGELVMRGYCGDAEATRRALRDGWLHTGDIGYLDVDGHLHITDRKKDIIVNSGGENIAPQRVEGFLTLQPEIGQAMVYGDKRPHLVALLVPDADFLKDWNHNHGKHYALAEAVTNHRFQESMGEVIHRLNKQLAAPERIRRFALADRPFTVENEMLTPSMKIRRHKINAAFGASLEQLYR